MEFQNQQKPILLISLLLTMSLLFACKPTSTESNDEEFIKKSCKESDYPDLCYTSLSPFAGQVNNSSEKLAMVSLTVCLSKVQQLKSHVQDLAKKAKGPKLLLSALETCEENFGSAIDIVKQSIKQMKDPKARGATGKLQTLMSATISFEGTCEDNFTGVPDGAEKKDVLDQTDTLLKITGISFSMIDLFLD